MLKNALAILLLMPLCAGAGETEKCDFPSFSEKTVQACVDAYLLHQPVSMPLMEREIAGDEKIIKIWKGEEPTAESAVLRARFWFKPAAGDRFFIEASWTREAVTLRHSQPLQASLIGGMRIPWESAEKTLMLQGQNRSSFYVGKPATKMGALFPLLLCSRDEAPPDTEYLDNQLVDPGHTFIGFEADAQGIAEGQIKSSIGPSSARAEIQTTTYVRSSAPWNDESRAVHPRVRLEYRPDSAWSMPEFDAASFSPQGIRSLVRMVNSGGYRIARSHDARVGFQNVEVKELPRIQIGVRTFYPKDGSCYILIRQDVLRDEYSFESAG